MIHDLPDIPVEVNPDRKPSVTMQAIELLARVQFNKRRTELANRMTQAIARGEAQRGLDELRREVEQFRG